MSALIGDIVENTVGKVIDRVLDKYLPSTLGEKEREGIRNETRRLALEEYRAAVSEVQGARDLAASEAAGAPSWTKVLTVTHRPAWSYLTLAVFLWTIIAPYAGFPSFEITGVHKEIMQTVIIFYFGGRSVEKVTGALWGKYAQTKG